MTAKASQPEDVDVGFTLWDQAGEVVLSTQVWGGEGVKVIRSGARVLDPAHFIFWDEVLVEPDYGEPIWMMAEYDAKLVGQTTVDLTATRRYLKTPGADPYSVAVYRGTLRPITAEEAGAMLELLKRRGWEVKGKIRSGASRP
ncbi:MAG: hypothetical protein WA005_01730 [Candidatus Binataceae bacterium]